MITRRLRLFVAFVAITVPTGVALSPDCLAAQPGVSYTDTYCPLVLNDNVDDYQPVKNFDDWQYDFRSVWFSVLKTTPLPSANWYHAYPNVDIADESHTVVWKDAQIQVHCFWEQTPFYSRLHYDQIGSSGRLIKECTGSSGGGVSGSGDWGDSEIASTSYDPYSALDVDNGDCESPPVIDDSGGGAGRSDCRTEYLYVDVSTDGGLTWTTVWEGEVEVCG